MKRYLLSFLFFSALAILNKVNAQCTVSQPTIKLNSRASINGVCTLNFDLTFDLPNSNGGNKMQVIHLWRPADYNTALVQGIYGSSNNSVPSVADLNASNTVATLVIDKDLATTQCYNRNGSGACSSTQPTSQQLGKPVLKTINGTTITYTIQNIIVAIPGACLTPITLIADVWSTQSSSLNSVSCLARNKSFYVNDPIITGFKTCSNPRTYSLGITSSTAMTVYYEVYKDNGNGNFEASTDELVYTSGNLSTPVSLANQTYPGSDQAGENSDLWIRVLNTADLSYSTLALFAVECTPLPVAFKSFTATKGTSSVALRWTTATEVNSKGFYVQRYYNGKWDNLMFVATKAEGGNSQSDLNYTYTDNSYLSGTVQYRILQLDLDNKAKFSEIRSISDAIQANHLLVYPNPSTNGIVSIVLNDANATYDIKVLDASGRIVKLYNSVRNTLQISSLPRGQYLAKVINQQSGESKVEKFIILK
jgi:hypothetical protein